jgi:hypothetical protein
VLNNIKNIKDINNPQKVKEVMAYLVDIKLESANESES